MVLAIVAAVFLAVGVVGVAVTEKSDGSTEGLAGNASPSSNPKEEISPSTAPGQSPQPNAAPSPAPAASNQVQPGKPDPGMPPTAVPRPGRYRYRITATSAGQEQQPETRTREFNLVIESEESSPTETRQAFRLEDPEGASGGSITLHVVWRQDGFYEDGFTSTGPAGASTECDWRPDHLELTLPLGLGASWMFDSTCTSEFGQFRRSGSGSVPGKRAVEVGGERADVWEIQERTSETRSTPQGSSSTETSSEDLFSPKHGLMVRSQRASQTRLADGRTSSGSQTIDLLGFAPS